jgi:hypothetical protein
MKKKRGRPESLLARTKDATREEICNTIIYGTPAWRYIRLYQLIDDERKRLLGKGRKLFPNYLSQGLRAVEAHIVHARANAEPNIKALDRLWNELFAKNKGKPPTRSKWLKERDKLLTQLPKPPPQPNKTWIEAACLWRELSQQIEYALVIGDDEWLDELAKAIRGEASPEQSAQFTNKVLDILREKASASPRGIFNALGIEEMLPNGTWKTWDKKKKLTSRLRVRGHVFENKARVMDAIHDIAAKVGHEFERLRKPLPNGCSEQYC